MIRDTIYLIFLGQRDASQKRFSWVLRLESEGAMDACKSDRSRQELSLSKIFILQSLTYFSSMSPLLDPFFEQDPYSNEYLLSKSASIQPRTSSLKFAKS